MHLLLGGALNKYWVMRMDDFYTTHSIKSMELRQNCQKKVGFPTTHMKDGSDQVNADCSWARSRGWRVVWSSLAELQWSSALLRGQGYYRCRSPKFSVLRSRGFTSSVFIRLLRKLEFQYFCATGFHLPNWDNSTDVKRNSFETPGCSGKFCNADNRSGVYFL